jgi:cytochrome c oxidase assembly protein subunit 16
MKFPNTDANANAARLKAAIERRPFVLFGLPFITIMVAGSFFLTPFTATRYESYDKKRRFLDKKDAIDSSGVKRRKFDAKEEYYVGLT